MTKYRKMYDTKEFYINDRLRPGWQWKRLNDWSLKIGKNSRLVIENKVYRYTDEMDVRIWQGSAKYFMSIKKDFEKELSVCEKIIEEAFPDPQITYAKYTEVIYAIDSIFYDAYTTIFKFISSYPEEDDYSSHIVSQAKNNLQRYFKLLQDCTKELSKLLLKDEKINLSYIEESINQIQDYTSMKVNE